MKIHLFILLLLLTSFLSAQDQDYPVATPTDQKGVVLSPYDSTRQLDVTGIEPGSLAQDPVAKKIFRIPDPAPSKDSGVMIIPPPIKAPTVNPNHSISPVTPPQNPVPAEFPNDLLSFIYAFNQNSTVNDPDALLPFFAEQVEDYFGEKNVSKTTIRNDRASYMSRYPKREYILEGLPVLLGKTDDTYEVMTRVKFKVQGSEKSRDGTVSDYFKIRRANRRFEILSLNEAKITTATVENPSQTTLSVNSNSVLSAGSVYNRFEHDQIALFVIAFAASGEVNDPSAMIDFLHPQITTYYTMQNPTREELMKDRRDYIQRWPGRRYWLTENPVIKPNQGGSWDVVSKIGYEVKNNEKTASSETTSSIRIVQTNSGLKILSITTL